MSVPVKYRQLGDFWEYYKGARLAPYLTIFVGGNHEASNYMTELYYGGWVAPNIYYMGAANVLQFGGLRIAGLSGIWKGPDFRKPHFERAPYNDNTLRSVYHVREIDTRKLLQLKTQVDIGLSHDWPRGVEWKGNHAQLFRYKPDLKGDADNNTLGSTAAWQVLDHLRPSYWFSAHLHARYTAIVQHDAEDDSTSGDSASPDADGNDTNNAPPKDFEIRTQFQNGTDDPLDSQKTEQTDEFISLPRGDANAADALQTEEEEFISLSVDDTDDLNILGMESQMPTQIFNTKTHFLALSKFLPGQQFLQLLEIPINTSSDTEDTSSMDDHNPQLYYDPEWLAITRVFADDIRIGGVVNGKSAQDRGSSMYAPLIEKELQWVQDHVTTPEKLKVPHNFRIVAPVQKDPGWAPPPGTQTQHYDSPQTRAFCELLQITNPLDRITPAN